MSKFRANRPVYLIDGLRTPFLKARGRQGPFKAIDLLVGCGKPLLLRQPFDNDAFDEVIIGCVMPGPNEANIARIATLRLNAGTDTPAWTVQRNCASGMQALDSAAQRIRHGYSDLVLAGGVESMSQSPLLLNDKMVNWFADMNQSRTLRDKIRTISTIRPAYLKPVIGLLCGLTDPVVKLSMGQTAEILAKQFSITRNEMDAFSVQSHKRVLHAQEAGYFDHEVTPMFDTSGKYYDLDDGVRPDSSPEKLAKLKPYFDTKYGMVTPGNSSQITDGASLLVLASDDAVKKYNLSPRAEIVDCAWSALDPAAMGLGPAHSITHLLRQTRLTKDAVDFWEINEAFAAQVLACLRALEDEDYCHSELGLKKAFGEIDPERLNIDGGAISLGHPVGASGARIVLHLLNVLERKEANIGVASLCIGGGQGGAMLIRRNVS
jgi:acetyl-CoA C-acetyltransferase